MPRMDSFEASSLRLLKQRIDEVIRTNCEDLANGNALVANDLIATGGNYYSATGYVRALNDVLAMCKDVEDQLLKG